MITPGSLSNWSVAQSRTENLDEYNWWLHNVGTEGLYNMYDLNKVKHVTLDKTKSKEYNLINKEYVGVIKEIEDFKKSIQNTLKDIARKLRDIDRLNPNNFEDYNSVMITYGQFKGQELSAIKEKASFIKNKHDTLMKILKTESDLTGGGGGGGGATDPISQMARLLGALPKAGNNPVNDSIVRPMQDDPALNTGEPMDIDEIRRIQDGNAAKSSRENLVVAAGEDLGGPRSDTGVDPYTVAITKFPGQIKERYCVQPDTGFGYVEFESPDGTKGIKPTSVRSFQSSYVDYINKTVLDSTRISYEVVEVDAIPDNVVQEWRTIFDGPNRWGVKK